jgi:hypothetical protein
MLIDVETPNGPRKVRVCDYCRCVCIPRGRFCSGRCSRSFDEWQKTQSEMAAKDSKRDNPEGDE